MDELLKILADTFGDTFTDEARAKVTTAYEAAAKADADKLSDEHRAETKRATKDLKIATDKVAKIEAKLADASGDTDERLGELRTALDESRVRVGVLEDDAVKSKLRSRVKRALRGAEVSEDRRDAALELIKLDGVEIDDESDSGLAGVNSAIESLKAKHGFLWETGKAEGGSGNGGKRAGGDPPPKPPTPKTTNPADAVRAAVEGRWIQKGLRKAAETPA